jgi:hypothetical protein
MATERTMMHPSGYVITFDVADETYMHPSGYVVEGDIEAVSGFNPAWAYDATKTIGFI